MPSSGPPPTAAGGRSGCATDDPAVFDGVPMSADDTGERQRPRLGELGLSFTELEQLRDVDTLADAEAVAAVTPWTRMSAALRADRPEGIRRLAPGSRRRRLR